MRAPLLPIVASAALLASGIIGLGAYYIYSQNRVPVTQVEPLFARSVELGGLPPKSRWPTERLDVPFYGPMVELLTLGASASRISPTDQGQRTIASPPQAESPLSGAEQKRQTRRVHPKGSNNKTRSTEVDPRDAYARGDFLHQNRGSTGSEEESRERPRRAREAKRAPPMAADRLRLDDRGYRDSAGAPSREEKRNQPEGITPFRMFDIFNSR